MNSATGCVRCLGLRETDIVGVRITVGSVARHSRNVTRVDFATVHLQRTSGYVDATTTEDGGVAGDAATVESHRPAVVDAATNDSGGVAGDWRITVEGHLGVRAEVIDAATTKFGEVVEDAATIEGHRPVVPDTTTIVCGRVAGDPGIAFKLHYALGVLDATRIRGRVSADGGVACEGDCFFVVVDAATVGLGAWSIGETAGDEVAAGESEATTDNQVGTMVD